MLPGGKLYVPGAEKLLPNIRRLTDAARRGEVFLFSHGCFHTANDPEFQQFPPHTFSGLASVPIVRNDLVLHRHVLTDRKLNTSLAITRTTPGPMGLYVVSVGYFVDGTPGAVAGWLAMITPALLMIPLLEFV